MSRLAKAEVGVFDAMAPLRNGTLRLVRLSENPQHLQVQLAFPGEESAVSVVELDELFLALRTVMPEYGVEVQPTILPTMLQDLQTPPADLLTEEEAAG